MTSTIVKVGQESYRVSDIKLVTVEDSGLVWQHFVAIICIAGAIYFYTQHKIKFIGPLAIASFICFGWAGYAKNWLILHLPTTTLKAVGSPKKGYLKDLKKQIDSARIASQPAATASPSH
ncbi:MAG: hypothetical protein P4M09_25695 [Devosia sp.]|nr:hypothetical protein [Devosia sp.]